MTHCVLHLYSEVEFSPFKMSEEEILTTKL